MPAWSSSTAMIADDEGNDARVVRRITKKPSPQLQRDLDRLQDRKDLALRDVDRAQTTLNTANRELSLANRVGNPVEVDKWGREVSNAESALRAAQTEVGKIDDELQSRMRELGKTVVEPSVNAPISPRDELNVTVAEDETLNGIYQVKSAGYISMPRGIRVNVAGKSIADAEQLIKETLEGRELKIATVTVERTRPDLGFGNDVEEMTTQRGGGPIDIPDRAPDVIYLAGEFNNPGPLRIPPGVNPTLLTIVLRSGGLTPSADLQKVKLLHFDAGQSRGSVEEINVQGILQGIGSPVDFQLTPGDIVFVPGFTPVVYVTGNVMRPGALRLFQDEPITAYSAILRSGGFSRFANTKKVSVMRDLGNGEKAAIPINIKDIQQGRQPDVVLQGRDIVFVPEAFFSF
ncbi:MAG: SLBB domain-containing protein [Verrucomicrobia bacterium]|nr:SLBB domain-containing protein [Verrucomicrobiota bacterium]